jgi:drug/metabolite transporter (DMT)-like permease
VSASAAGAFGLAAASALALNWAYFAQHQQASRLPPLSLRRPLRSLALLFSNRRWFAGFVIGIGGWVLYVAALSLGTLSLVQAASAGGIGVLALLVWRLGGVRLSRREWAGVGLAIAGLVLLAVSLTRSGTSHPFAAHASWTGVAAWMAATGVVAAAFAGPLSRLLAGGAGLGVAAGLCYAAGDVGTKAAVGGGARFLFVPPVLSSHGLGFVCLQLGFQRGGALATAGVATLFTNAVPIAAGMVLYGDGLPAGALGVARLLSFAAVVAGAVLLTRGPGLAVGAVPAASVSTR